MSDNDEINNNKKVERDDEDEEENEEDEKTEAENTVVKELTDKEIQDIKEKTEELITLNNKRKELRELNDNENKRLDFMDFSRLTFEQIHKSSKKFAKINKETFDMLMEEIESVNFSKVIEEIPKIILEPKFESKDIPFIVNICSELNQIYDNFGVAFKDALIKELKAVSQSNTQEVTKKGANQKDKKTNEKQNEKEKQEKEKDTQGGGGQGVAPEDTSNPVTKENPFIIMTSKQEEDEDKKISRKKNLYKLLIESYLSGLLLKDFAIIKDLFKRLLTTTPSDFNHFFPILVFLIKNFGESLFSMRSKPLQQLISKGTIKDYKLDYCKDITDFSKYQKSFQDYYFKIVLGNLEEKNKYLLELEKKNMESLSRLESSTEIQEKYAKLRVLYMKFLTQVTDYSDSINCNLPDFANEKFLRVEESKKAATKLEKINKYDPFSDEEEYMFYNKFMDLKESHPTIHEKLTEKSEGKDNNKENKENLNLEDDDFKKKFDVFSTHILKCDSKDSCDDAFIEFLTYLNYHKFRKMLPRLFLRGSSKTNFSLLKYYGRFTRNFLPYYKELKDDIYDMLMNDFYNGFNSDKLNNMDERCKNLKIIAEMVKFDLFNLNTVLQVILVKLFEDFSFASIELLCLFLESCGRYLFLNENSHLKFNTFLNEFKQTASYKIYYDSRMYNSVLNTIQICKPNEHLLKQKVKIRSIEEEYIKYLLFSELSKENVKKIAFILRRMSWGKNIEENEDQNNKEKNEEENKENNKENNEGNKEGNKEDKENKTDVKNKSNENTQSFFIFKYLYRLLINGKETQSYLACVLLIHLKDSHPDLINNILITLIEELRICLERFAFEDNQHKMLICSILGRLYEFNIISTDLVYFLLYFIIIYSPDWNYGITKFKSDNIYDSGTDFSRILMVVNLLEVSGGYLKGERLKEYIHFFQIYILTKKYLPSDVENLVLNCLESILGKNFLIYNDFSQALTDSKKFKGLNNEDNEEEDENNSKKNTQGRSIYADDNEVIVKKVVVINEEDEFERNEVSNKDREKINKEKYNDFDVDSELQKIINESISKAKNTNTMSNLNIEEDLKKNKVKEKKEDAGGNEETGKKNFKFITKLNGKPVIKSIKKKVEE